ncbi:hypothetical protein CHLNCDRAFT_144402 [Chlorella variabilis]|uniref:Uncharacterized protein n=1 Tax=Chlorella variabilis TaxID=554065 RepID=E1ZBD1_CHLVA|nr:hypothetical protein CHLNCDRAFT_144402 [Chlorella variabilis]EFN56834.1 hypothetical protein CHLNCDRAFT_144402 [Chlorella variabilis]|eukprot:XP_005848936.1 hypothetical protein CHLNCDRAFT_144402 [Chlorella variabilis]
MSDPRTALKVSANSGRRDRHPSSQCNPGNLIAPGMPKVPPDLQEVLSNRSSKRSVSSVAVAQSRTAGAAEEQEAVAGVQGAFTTSSGRRTAATAEKSTPDWRRAATPRQRGTSSSSSSMLPRQQHRAAWSAALAVVACLGLAAAPLAAHAAVKLGGDTDMEGSSLLTPTRGEVMGRTFYFEIPHNPVGVLFMAHGCVHDAADFWPPSKACPECSGLPEEVSHTKQALARGYAVLAVDSKDRDPMSRCYSYGEDKWGVKYVLENWMRQYSLQALPVFGLGISAGASFVLRLPKLTRVNGIISEVLGATYETFPVDNLGATYPPTIFIDMQRDRTMTARIAQSMQKLMENSVPTAKIAVDPRPVTRSFFSDRSEFISPELSRRIVSGLHQIGMIDDAGMVTSDPRYTTQPWRDQLAEVLPELEPDTGETAGPASDWALISEQMNLAWATHEIVGDHLAASLAWLESEGTAAIDQLERELQIKRQTATLSADRQQQPEMQDDEALKEAAKQVAEQLATTTGERDNWGDLYAAYVAWLKANPTAAITFPAWRAAYAPGRMGYKDAAHAAEERAAARAAAAAAGARGEALPGAREALGVAPQHTSL